MSLTAHLDIVVLEGLQFVALAPHRCLNYGPARGHRSKLECLKGVPRPARPAVQGSVLKLLVVVCDRIHLCSSRQSGRRTSPAQRYARTVHFPGRPHPKTTLHLPTLWVGCGHASLMLQTQYQGQGVRHALQQSCSGTTSRGPHELRRPTVTAAVAAVCPMSCALQRCCFGCLPCRWSRSPWL